MTHKDLKQFPDIVLNASPKQYVGSCSMCFGISLQFSLQAIANGLVNIPSQHPESTAA